MTILVTGLTAYLISVIAKQPQLQPKSSAAEHFNRPPGPDYESSAGAAEALIEEEEVSSRGPPAGLNKSQRRKRKVVTTQARFGPKSPLGEPLVLESSEIVATRVRPANELHTSHNLQRLKRKLAHLNRSDLIKLLGLVQERIDNSIKKRQAEAPMETLKLEASASGGSVARIQNNTTVNNASDQANVQPVVVRSAKMEQLMGYLEKIETNMPQLNATALDRLTALNDELSIVRVVKPETLNSVLQANGTDLKPLNSQQQVGSFIESSPFSSWHEPVESVAPDSDWWPQQQKEPVEDWSPVTQAPVTQRPRKKKRKRVRTTTTTTYAPETTTYYQQPSSSSSPAPQTALEEVWIEEEEEIVRPPRRKTKKYKKRTQPEQITTSTTTTTRIPTRYTTTQQPAIIEDWPEEQWPQQEQASSTKAPHKWPEQLQQVPEEEHQKWPEEEWLNALRDDIQSRLHLVYA